MQKFILSIICLFLITGSAFAKAESTKFKLGIQQYKIGNYIGASETMQQVIATDPGNAVAHYYLAISYVQIGKKDEAIKEYNNVISLNPAPKLVSYSKQGLSYLGIAQEGVPSTDSLPQITNIPDVNKTKDYISDKVKDTLREKELNKVINDANSNNGQVDPNSLQRIDNYTNKKSENSTPTKEQIAQAMQILSSAGMNQNYNPETAQMNMLMNSLGGMSGMNNGYNNNSMNMLPLLMMAQNSGNKQNMDPQMMEVMINSMMMPGMMQFTSGNNDNNNY